MRIQSIIALANTQSHTFWTVNIRQHLAQIFRSIFFSISGIFNHSYDRGIKLKKLNIATLPQNNH